MAISNPVSIGTATPTLASASSIALTTSTVVSSGGKIFVWVGWFGTTTLSSVTGGSLAWTVDSTAVNASGGKLALAWADAPSGLASGTILTANFSAGSTSRFMAAAFVTGAATGVATGRISGITGTTAWTSGALTVASGSILVGGCYGNTTSATNTASGGNTEIHDQNISTDSCQTTCYQLGTGASIASSGTWTASQTNSAIGVVFAPTAAAGSRGPAGRIVGQALTRAAVWMKRRMVIPRPSFRVVA